MTSITMLAPNSGTEDVVTVASNLSKVHSLKAAIFHTMAFKISLEINKNKITQKSPIAFWRSCTTSPKSKKKKITFQQYSRIHLVGPKIAICETTSNVVFVLDSSFTSKDQYFRATIQEDMTAFNNTLQDSSIMIHTHTSGSSSTAKSLISVFNQQFHSLLVTLQIHPFFTSSSFFDNALRCSC